MGTTEAPVAARVRRSTWRRGLRLGAVIVALAAAALVIGGAFAFHARVVDERSLFRRVAAGDSHAPGGAVVQGRATLSAPQPGALPLCQLLYKANEPTHGPTFHDTTRVRFADGRTYSVADSVRMEFVDHESPTSSPSTDIQALAEDRANKIAQSEYTLRCVRPDEPVFIQACVRGARGVEPANAASDEVVPCPGDGAIPVVLGGSSAPLRSQRVQGGMSWLFGALSGWTVVALVVWVLCASSGATGDRLVGGRVPSARSAFGAFAVLAVAALLSPLTWGDSLGPLVTAFCTTLALAMIAVMFARRVRRIVEARRALAAMPVGSFAQADAELRKLSVYAAREPLVEGVIGGTRHAFVRAVITEHIIAEKIDESGAAERASNMKVRTVDEPPRLAVESAGGWAQLEMKDCELNLASEGDVDVKPSNGPLPSWLAQRLVPSPGHERFAIEWWAIDPAEPLFILGSVVTESAEAPFREAATRPVLRGGGVVCLGHEEDYLRRLTREALALGVLIPTHVLATLAGIAATVFAFSR